MLQILQWLQVLRPFKGHASVCCYPLEVRGLVAGLEVLGARQLVGYVHIGHQRLRTPMLRLESGVGASQQVPWRLRRLALVLDLADLEVIELPLVVTRLHPKVDPRYLLDAVQLLVLLALLQGLLVQDVLHGMEF